MIASLPRRNVRENSVDVINDCISVILDYCVIVLLWFAMSKFAKHRKGCRFVCCLVFTMSFHSSSSPQSKVMFLIDRSKEVESGMCVIFVLVLIEVFSLGHSDVPNRCHFILTAEYARGTCSRNICTWYVKAVLKKNSSFKFILHFWTASLKVHSFHE